MQDYLNMGGYAAFIWPGYGISLLVLLGLTIYSLHANRRARHQVEALEGEGGGVYGKSSASPSATASPEHQAEEKSAGPEADTQSQ